MSLKLPWLIIRLPAAGITLEKHDYWQIKCMSCEYVQSRVQYTASRICSIKVLFIPWESTNLIAKNNLLGIYFEVRIINHFESKMMDNLSFVFSGQHPFFVENTIFQVWFVQRLRDCHLLCRRCRVWILRYLVKIRSLKCAILCNLYGIGMIGFIAIYYPPCYVQDMCVVKLCRNHKQDRCA